MGYADVVRLLRIRAMVSDVPLMYGIVAVFVGVELAFVSVVSVGR